MSTLTHVQLLSVAACALALLQCSGGGEGDDEPNRLDRPNVIVIMVDDMNPELLQFMPTVQSELVAKGTSYSNAFAPTPTCCPGRASFLTGQYAHNHGVLNNRPPDGGFEAFDDSQTLAVWLQEAGYQTGLFGKYFNGYASDHIPPGWDRWVGGLTDPDRLGYYGFRANDGGEIRELDEEYSTDWFAEQAVEFIEEGSEQPLFVFYTPWAPHPPPEPARRHEGSCREPGFRGPAVNEEDVSDKPAWVKELRPRDVEQVDRVRNKQICTLKAVDEALGDLLDALGDELENSIVIFTSDNGYSYGDHRWQGKECLYQACARIPLVIRGAGLAAGVTIDEFALNIDLAPTILAATGALVPGNIDGEDLADGISREDFILEVWRPEDDGRNGAALRTERWLYIELDSGERELYDLEADPDELVNVANDPAFAAEMTELSTRLTQLREE